MHSFFGQEKTLTLLLYDIYQQKYDIYDVMWYDDISDLC